MGNLKVVFFGKVWLKIWSLAFFFIFSRKENMAVLGISNWTTYLFSSFNNIYLHLWIIILIIVVSIFTICKIRQRFQSGAILLPLWNYFLRIFSFFSRLREFQCFVATENYIHILKEKIELKNRVMFLCSHSGFFLN